MDDSTLISRAMKLLGARGNKLTTEQRSRGGLARAKKLTKARRREIAQLAAAASAKKRAKPKKT